MKNFRISIFAILLLLTAVLYVPSLHFGFIWDDPIWFGRVVGKSAWELLKPIAEYHFYRPGTLLINGLFVQPAGTFLPAVMHAFQIAIHLLNVALVARLCLDLGIASPLPLVTAALFASYPLLYQAVVWLQSPQSWSIFLVLITAHTYIVAHRRSSRAWYALSPLAYLLALLVQESAVQILPVICVLEWRLRGDLRAVWRSRPLWLFGALTAGYLVLWTQVPRAHGITGVAFEPEVAWYLLQGIAFPLMGAAGGFPESLQPYVRPLIVAVVVWLAIALVYQKRGWILVGGIVWYGAALFSTWAGLRYSYVCLSSRQFYLAAFGAALLWAAVLFPPGWMGGVSGRLWRGLGSTLVAVVLLQSTFIIRQFNALYRAGTSQVAELTEVLKDRDTERLLFVNFPDRYALRRSPYPLGYWGVTLAPISVPLGAFGRVINGHEIATENISMPVIGYHEREAGPYQVDMRGSQVAEEAAYAKALAADAVYLTQYDLDGSMKLEYVGRVSADPPGEDSQAIARFGGVAELLAEKSWFADGQVYVQLRWRALSPGEQGDLVFVHLVRSDTGLLAQADSSPGHGLFPLWVWEPGHVIEEVRRFVPLAGTIPPDQYDIYVGLYNWLRQERLIAELPDGTHLPEDTLPVDQVAVGLTHVHPASLLDPLP